MSAPRYVSISSAIGATAAEHGVELPPGEVFRCRAEHLTRMRGNDARLDDACESGRIAIRRIALAGDEAEAADRAWRAVCQPWRLASSTLNGEGVRDPDAGLATANATRSLTGGVR